MVFVILWKQTRIIHQECRNISTSFSLFAFAVTSGNRVSCNHFNTINFTQMTKNLYIVVFPPRNGILWCVVVAGFYQKNPWIAFFVCTVYCVRALQMSIVYLAISMWMNLKAIVNSSASNYISHFLHVRAWFMDVLLVFWSCYMFLCSSP